jgi:hypothetical protein
MKTDPENLPIAFEMARRIVTATVSVETLETGMLVPTITLNAIPGTPMRTLNAAAHTTWRCSPSSARARLSYGQSGSRSITSTWRECSSSPSAAPPTKSAERESCSKTSSRPLS